MQLKFKKIFLLTTVFVYCLSFLFQSNFSLFQALAEEKNIPRVNIVAVLVDSKIYDGISSNLEWYTTNYVQKKLTDTKALVMPLDLSGISAYDIHRMMENIYFDGLEGINSSLIGLIMVGNIPFPVVNQNGYIFPTVYPYVDFEDQKYIRDSNSRYFVYNDNPSGQAEIWHGLINYGDDISAYNKFFGKIKEYVKNPDNFIGDSFWYEDFIASKEGFLNENFPYYRNKIMFGEDLSYQRYSPLMKKIFEGESVDNSIDILGNLSDVVSEIGGNADVILDSLNDDSVKQLQSDGTTNFRSTKIVQQEIQDGFLADYDDLFSKTNLSIMRENVLAGGRWIKDYEDENGKKNLVADSDTSASMIQLKDTMYLGTDNLQGLLENLNELMENMVDKKIEEEKYSMDIVIPVEYKKVTGKRVSFKCRSFVSRFENFYFGNSARYIDSAEDLSIYRGTYRNLSSLSGVSYSSLLVGNNPVVGKFDNTDVKLKSIGASYDIFSNQAEGNRGYAMLDVEGDLDTYDDNKTAKNATKDSKTIFGRIKRKSRPELCKEGSKKKKYQCETLNEFAKRWWGGASSINLVEESVSEGRYQLSGYTATDSWRPIYGMGGFQSLSLGSDEGLYGKGWVSGTGLGPQWEATNYKSYVKYSSPTQREGWRTTRWMLIGKGYEIYENHTPDVHMNFNDIDYWKLNTDIMSGWVFSKESSKIFNVSKTSSKRVLKCGGSEKYSYKVISSVVKHDSTTQDEINGIDKDRYGESGTLGIYYRDIKNAYDDLYEDMSGILVSFPELLMFINSGNQYIEDKIMQLDEAGNVLSGIKQEIGRLNGEINSLNASLDNLNGNLQSFVNQKNILEENLSYLESLPSSDEIIQQINQIRQEIAQLESKIQQIQNNISVINTNLSLLSQNLTEEENSRNLTESNISDILDEVKEFLFSQNGEKDKLIDIYRLIMGLYVENIISVMEYIVYLEGGDPEEFYSTGTDVSLVKIGFLPSWIDNINEVENQIKGDSRRVISYYSQAYSGLLFQQKGWNILASKLLEISDDNRDEINAITDDVNSIFTLREDGDDEVDGEVTIVTLTGGTARAEMSNLYGELEWVKSMFSKLVVVDETGPAIADAAKNDNDFINWLKKHSINYSSFSQTDWINQYSSRAKGPGYDSEGAKKNHDLLLGASEHMSGMNILTPDRPIDSPRYVSMQSIAGNEIKFIYPDLFKVEVFSSAGKNKSGYDVHELLTGGQIRENLVQYLKGKVNEYNQILVNEYKNAKSENVYFTKLKYLGFYLATSEKNKSIRPYNYFTYDDFEKALGGSGMITAISEMLYYQSLTNKKKLSTGSISDDIGLIKKSFSLNDKREQTLVDYLTEGNEKEKNPLFEIPKYELLGYEVAFVNSDGKDYIIPADDTSETTNFVKTSSSTNLNKQLTKQENELNDECNIPMNGKLPLFKLSGTSVSSPWLIGFKCWWKKTLEEPFKIKLTFDHSFGDVVVSSGFNEFIKSLGKSLFSETSDSLSAWGDSWSQYADARDTLVKGSTGSDSDKLITQLQIDAERHNQEYFGKLRNLRISNSNEILSDNNPTSLLKIESTSDIGNVKVLFTSTGDGCIKVNERDLCGGDSFTEVFNPKLNPFTGLVTSANHIAGKVGLDLKIYLGSTYVEKIIKYKVNPSNLYKFVIKVDDEKTFAGMITPVEVVGFDKYGNRVEWGLEKYDFTVTKGRFLKDGAYQSGFSTNDFRDLRFYYQAPLDAIDGDESYIQISKHTGSGTEYLTTYAQKLAQASPFIKLNGKIVLQGNSLVGSGSYRLKSDESVYNNGKLDISKLQKINVEIKDLKGNIVDLDSQILVTSQKGLVIIGQVQKGENGNYEFQETSKSYISGGVVTLYYYPKTVAGEDKINIEIPGLDTRVINFSILPGPIANIQTVLEKDVLDLGDNMDFELFLSDRWGNLIDGNKTVKVNYDEDKIKFINPNGGENGLITVAVSNGYGKYKIKGIGAGLSSLRVGSDVVYFNVDKHIFPNSGLNVLYLNYFGDDWGNQWGYFSDNNKYIESLMSKSNKVITTTTQLISEDKIKKMVWKLDPSFKVWNPDGISTSLSINGGKFNMVVGGITSMVSSVPSFQWITDKGDGFDLVKSLKNYILFIPGDSRYSIDKKGVLFDSGNRVFSVADGEIVLQLSRSYLDNGDNVWTIIDKGVNYGNIVIHLADFKPSVNNFDIPGERYSINSTFSDGSTDKISSVGIFDLLSDFELETNYKSIQNSNEIDEKVGFLGDFKNITLFAEGEIVGEATKNFGSEFVINLGDPVLSRKSLNDNVYGTEYDGGIGQEIYADPENDIFGTYQIDFNNDGYKDLLVVYLDGSIKLAKSYGGVPDLRNMQEVMRIAVPIEDVFVGDVDGNKYDDILIRTDNNQLRAYLNNKGIFDVDGNIACLNQNVFEGEISSNPSSLDGIFQLFVDDMDMDNNIDIITYDNKGYIKVFYGGKTNGGINYLSKDVYACDSGWYNREMKNTDIVAALGVQVSNEVVFDNSMLRWVGMNKSEIEISEDELSDYGINFDPNSLDSLITERKRNQNGSIDKVVHEIMDNNNSSSSQSNFDISDASQEFIDRSAKFVDVTLYESDLVGGTGNNYVFSPISYLDSKEDYAWARKRYSLKSGSKILQDGDVVTVTVTIKASNTHSFVGSFGDIIQGPWNLHYDKDGILEGIRFVSNQGGAILKKKDGNFSYIVDNIRLSPGETMVYEYDLEYKAVPLRKMSITYDTFYSNDELPDVKLQSIDGCAKDFEVYINGRRSYSGTLVPLQKMIDETYDDGDKNTEDYTQDVIDAGSDVNQLPGIVNNTLRRISLINGSSTSISDDEEGRDELKDILLKKIEEGGLESLNIDLSINLSVFEKETEDIEKVIDDITKGMCNGFSFGGSSNCKGLPVPFNQAFLAPGKYHLFGCRDLPLGKLEKGLPVFFFPGTLPTPLGPIPIPWGQTGPGDGFLWVGGGSWPSLIRIYAAPTLTAQLGIAVCVGPYAVGSALKSPFSDIGGNCVVFAIKPQCKNGNSDENLDNPDQSYVEFVEDVRDSGVCLQSQKGYQVTVNHHRSSPFNLYSYSSNYHLDLNGGSHNQVDISASLGIIELETSTYIAADDTINENSIIIGDVDILGGEYTVNKIKGGIQQGVRKLLIDKWLDPQIRYILNQLTKMHVNLKLPNPANLIDDEISVMQNVSQEMGNIISDEEKSIKPDFVSSFSNITSDNLRAYSESISNPFETLANLMNESNIINISTETLTVKIPLITSDEINSYEFYLNQRIERNTEIVSEWKESLNAFKSSCDEKSTVQEKELCLQEAQKNLEAFVEFENGDWQNMLNQIYANLVVLQQYRNFPFEIYEWIHVIDRYMSEIASLINDTIGYLSYWTVTNSERFVGYVDAIVLVLNIIKTYQLIIDFSVERSKNCGNCAKDTYDQYSCKLSLLCDSIQLPIIQIPNFKLPNITIDLTNMDLGLDVILPEFNFQPIRVNLPDLPNLPEPPAVGLNIKLFDLPNIPLLPQPPTLPELPSFIPEVELELPILPPAPELPKLPNKIEGIINVANLIGKIYCIVKGQFGLVGESSVKAKIEQLTQRTYEVSWIDNIMNFTNRSAAPIKNYGVDYEISSYVDLQFDFSSFYDYLDILTKGINNLSTSIERGLNNQITNVFDDNPLLDIRDSLDGANIQVNAKLSKGDDLLYKNVDSNGYTSDEIEYVDYDSAKDRLQDVLSFFKGELTKTTLSDSIGGDIIKIENQINRPNNVVANIDGLENIKGEVINYLDKEQDYYDDIADLINRDYNGFLAMVKSYENSILSTGGGKFLTFNTQLFNIDPTTKETIGSISKTNPYQSLVENKKEIIDGYWNAINSNNASDLGLSESQYLVLRDGISSLKNQVSTLYSVTRPVSSTKLVKDGIVSDKSLVAGNRVGSNLEVAKLVDPSAFSDGIYEKMVSGTESGKLTKVINSEDFVENVGGQYYKTNHKEKHDIILRDENSIYLKCAGQECSNGGVPDPKYYKSKKVIKEIPYEETRISFDSDTKLKIADFNQEVKNWKVIGQSYDTLTFSWTLDDVDAYLIKLVERIDHSYEKAEYSSNGKAIESTYRYILAVPEGTDIDKSLKIELIKKKIKSIDGLKELVDIVYYNNHKDVANVVISNVQNMWYYARISALNLNGDTYEITSPWSNQVVAGRQVVGDDQPPVAEQSLNRLSIPEVTYGDDLDGFVGTNYELEVKWKDNVALSYISISRNGRILAEKYTSNAEDSLNINVGMHFKAEKEFYDLVGIDQFGNKTEKTISVSYYVPDISITDISKNSDGETVTIFAELSQDLDQGNVSFQRRRGNVWKTMKRKLSESSDLELNPGMKNIVGSGYTMGNDIAMYDRNNAVIALMDPKTAEIKIQSGYENLYGINVSVTNSAVLNVYNITSNENTFSVSLPTKRCVAIEAENYDIVYLPENGRMGMFNGGSAVYKDGNMVLIASPTCHLYSELGLQGTYSFDRENNAVSLTLYQPGDLSKSFPIKVLVEINPFVAR